MGACAPYAGGYAGGYYDNSGYGYAPSAAVETGYGYASPGYGYGYNPGYNYGYGAGYGYPVPVAVPERERRWGGWGGERPRVEERRGYARPEMPRGYEQPRAQAAMPRFGGGPVAVPGGGGRFGAPTPGVSVPGNNSPSQLDQQGAR